MTVAEARREINKANAKLYRLNQGQFKGETPATQALDQRLERLGMKRTKKGFISTKGLSSKDVMKLGTQARQFSSHITSTTRGTLGDIAKRTGTMMNLTGLDKESLNSLYKIFDSKSYKRLKEIVGSDNVVAVASRKLREKPNIDIREWLYREELKIRKGEKSYEEFLNIDEAGEEALEELF